MPIIFDCDCGYRVRIKEEKAGRKIRCPECSEVLVVPDSRTSAYGTDTEKSKRRQSPSDTIRSKRSSSRSSSTKKKKTSSKNKYTRKQRIVLYVLLSTLAAIPALIRSYQRANENANQPQPEAVATQTARPEPKKDALSLLEAAAMRYPAPPEGSTRVMAFVPREQHKAVNDELLAKSGAKKSSFRYIGDTLTATLETPEIEDLASKISFGKVVKVDADTRTILVDTKTVPN